MEFNDSRSVGEEEEAEVVETYQIWFRFTFFCLSFVFHSCFSFVLSFLFP